MVMKFLPTILALAKPVCSSCKVEFQSMKSLDTHMKISHEESDIMRIERLKQTVQQVRKCEITSKIQKVEVSLDCTECGILFITRDEMMNHNKTEHSNNIEGDEQTSRKVKSLIDDMIENVIDLSMSESSSSENDVDSDKNEDDINIDYEYSV